MSDTDLQLLARYTRQHAEDAFTELVRRHLDLVYTAALRQVRSPQLAEEVAQSVFTDLSRNAPRLKPDTILTAWLYQVTRRTAIDVVRSEARRQLREQIAAEMNAMNATASDWTQIEPLLDEAMAALDETDRAAVLLRYFENKSLREVGAALGASDDAAQKRVSRAVERLREFFSKHGVTVGAGGLVVVISANAVQAAPVGLAVTISTAAAIAGTTIATTATATAIKTIAMTTLQKILVTATAAVLAGAGIYEARQASQLRDQVQTLQQRQAPLSEKIQQLQRERDEAKSRLVALTDEIANVKGNNNELLKLRGEVGVLLRQLAAADAKAQPATNQIMFNKPVFPRAAWYDHGTDTPQNTILTMFWAMRQGDQSKLEQIVSRLRDSQTLEDITLPRVMWDSISAIQLPSTTVIHAGDLKDQDQANVYVFVEKTPLVEGADKDVEIERWLLTKKNGQWLVRNSF